METLGTVTQCQTGSFYTEIVCSYHAVMLPQRLERGEKLDIEEVTGITTNTSQGEARDDIANLPKDVAVKVSESRLQQASFLGMIFLCYVLNLHLIFAMNAFLTL